MIFTSIAAAGPITARQLRSGEPAAVYQTSSAPQQVALCISEKLGPVSMLSYGSRDAITSRDRNSGIAIDIEDGTARVWRPSGFAGETKQVVEHCLHAAPASKN